MLTQYINITDVAAEDFGYYNRIEKRFKCAKCYKSYKQKSDLTRHVTIQCGKKPQEHCPYCNFITFFKFNLKKHISTTHSTQVL